VGADADHVVSRNLGDALEEEDSFDEALGVLHLAHRFLVVLVAEFPEAPVLAHLGLAEILVDGGQLDGQGAVQGIQHLRITLHAEGSLRCVRRRGESGLRSHPTPPGRAPRPKAFPSITLKTSAASVYRAGDVAEAGSGKSFVR